MVAMWSRVNVEVLVELREACDMQGAWYDRTKGKQGHVAAARCSRLLATRRHAMQRPANVY